MHVITILRKAEAVTQPKQCKPAVLHCILHSPIIQDYTAATCAGADLETNSLLHKRVPLEYGRKEDMLYNDTTIVYFCEFEKDMGYLSTSKGA